MDGIVILDFATAGVVATNSAFAEMLGYSAEEVRRLHVWDWDAKWSRVELEQKFATRDWPDERFESRHRRKAGLVQAFISMGKTLDMEIVAEGVETLAQSELLQQLGCRLGQGYLFGKPVPFTSMLATLGDDRETSNGPTGNQP